MQFTYPHTIENGNGEKIIFKRLVRDAESDWLEIEIVVDGNSGPPMHIHHLQEEHLTVVKGKMSAQVLGEKPTQFGPGEGATFKTGVAHKFWNSGDEPLICTGWIKPAHNFEYFLSELYASIKNNGGKRPGTFDGAWLLDRYRSEFDMLDIPAFVKKIIFPIALFFGKLQGKHKKFEGAPDPIK